MHHPCHAMHIISWSCWFFSVVVRIAYVVCSSICFFPDRISKWWCEIRQALRQVLRLFSDNLLQASISLQRFTYFWFVLLLSLSCVLVTCPIHLFILRSPYCHHLPPTAVVWFSVSALRVVGMLSAVTAVVHYRVICWGSCYMLHGKFRWEVSGLHQLLTIKQRHRWTTPL